MYPKKIEKTKSTAGFWADLAKPFFCLAPMSDVTDMAFRTILAKYGHINQQVKNVVFWTEFVAADGLCNKLARKKLSHILKYSEIERPIVAQVFGANPDNMEKACQYIASLGFDGIDINMGCPDKSVIAQGAGSALIRTPKLAREIIQAALKGIASSGQNIPLSVKTRIGFNKEEIDTWIPELLKENISALTIHLRTKKEMSLVPANWDYLKKVKDLIQKSGKETRLNDKVGQVLLIGNGDVVSLVDAREKALKYGCDGVMIGRGIFGNPWFFSDSGKGLSLALESARMNLSDGGESLTTAKQQIEALKEHIKLFDKELLIPGHKSYAVMKKHFKAYLNGFKGAKEIRNKLMNTNNPHQSISLLNDFKNSLKA